LGYDLLTYKTIRSHEHSGHPLPNIVYIDEPPLNPARFPNHLIKVDKMPPLERLGITNSFGMPSRDEAYLSEDIPKANSLIGRGQALIVSITGTMGSEMNREAYIQDFVKAARLAEQSGAKILEANFSCPNVSQEEGALYLHPESCFEVASRIVENITAPLIIKVGHFPNKKILEKTLVALSCAGVKAVSGINSLSFKVIDQNGAPALGKGRLFSGVCGAPIRECALQFVTDARFIIAKEKLPLTLIGGGGIMEPSHFDDFFNAGADFAFTATGMMWRPLLAHEYKTQKEAYARS
ncbi:MAG: dihydroorotate dehydrogenase, partial [Parachlamydiaceae bacterium]